MSKSMFHYPAPSTLTRRVKYDRSQGTLYNKKTGNPLTLIFRKGEQVIATKNGLIAAADLAYLCVYNEWPSGPLTFGNGDAFDLRWANLHVDEPRCPGVYWYRRSRKWQGMFQHNYKYVHVGYFDSQDEAAEAVQEKKEALASEGN